jgi:hypothetical protein
MPEHEPAPDDAGRDLGRRPDLAASEGCEEREEATGVSRLGVFAVPVALAHVAALWLLARSVFGFSLPAFLHGERVVAWLWVNGGLLGLAVWFWRKGRVPVADGKWLAGTRARGLVLLWLAASLAWFLLPAFLGDLWNALSGLGGGW